MNLKMQSLPHMTLALIFPTQFKIHLIKYLEEYHYFNLIFLLSLFNYIYKINIIIKRFYNKKYKLIYYK